VITSLNSNGGHGKGGYFVAEADESDGSFLSYQAFGAIVTNIDNDHLDYWKTPDRMMGGFHRFLEKIQSPPHLFWCGDDRNLRALKPKGYSYGFDAKNDLQIKAWRQEGWSNIFDLFFEGIEYTEIQLPLIGGHNVLNAAAVFGMGIKIGLQEERIRRAFGNFKGVSRRAEWKGGKGGIAVFDDYGHHPTEIFATLRAVKQAVADRRLVVAFQPHRYTRTRDCLHEFGVAFERADLLVLTDIYSAGEVNESGITNEILFSSIKNGTILDVRFAPRETLSEFLAHLLQPEDVLLTMGAGDITRVGPEVLKLLHP
jgi:UDP-N-acetylmuramate--alanine ligase